MTALSLHETPSNQTFTSPTLVETAEEALSPQASDFFKGGLWALFFASSVRRFINSLNPEDYSGRLFCDKNLSFHQTRRQIANGVAAAGAAAKVLEWAGTSNLIAMGTAVTGIFTSVAGVGYITQYSSDIIDSCEKFYIGRQISELEDPYKLNPSNEGELRMVSSCLETGGYLAFMAWTITGFMTTVLGMTLIPFVTYFFIFASAFCFIGRLVLDITHGLRPRSEPFYLTHVDPREIQIKC